MICLECKKELRSIGYLHLKYCCGLSPAQYKEKYNIKFLMDQDVRDSCAVEQVGIKDPLMELTEYTRICGCGEIIKHTGIGCYYRAMKAYNCYKCVDRSYSIGRIHSEETKNKISKANKGQEYNKSRLGITESQETRKRKSNSLKGRTPGFNGKIHTEETKRKQREGRLADIDSKYPFGWTALNYNVKACRLFDEINLELGWNGVHAEHVGEFRVCGYLLDYYEPNENVVIEFDEAYHNSDNQKHKDKLRQETIVNELKCRFYRIKDGEEDDWRNVVQSV
jgi:hypothetical protein